MKLTRFIILLWGKWPLQWPSEAYPLHPDFDPGQIVKLQQEGTRFESYADADSKATEHYRSQDFEVRLIQFTL